MHTPRTLVPAVSAGFLFVASGPPLHDGAEKIAFHPEAGSTLHKTFLVNADFSLDELSVVVDGQDVGGMLGSLEITAQQETRYEVTDEYQELAEGRPKKLARTFDGLGSQFHMSLSSEMGGGDQDQEMKSSSELEGETVVFSWNDEKGAYDITFKDGKGDADLLEDLKEDMDLRSLLPSNEVSKDDTWKVELKDLQALAMPGGDLSLLPENSEVDPEQLDMFKDMFGDLGQNLADLLEGECTCTFRGVREESGSRLADIGVELKIACTIDLTEFFDKVMEKVMERAGGGDMPEISIETADLNLDYDGVGTLLWDLQTGHAHSFQISGDADLALDFSVSVEAQGESHAAEASLELSGTVKQEVETGE